MWAVQEATSCRAGRREFDMFKITSRPCDVVQEALNHVQGQRELVHVVYFSALVVMPSPYRFLFVVPILVAPWASFQHTLHFHTALEYTYASAALAQVFYGPSYILINDVQRTVFDRGQKELAHRLPLVERIKWANRWTAA